MSIKTATDSTRATYSIDDILAQFHTISADKFEAAASDLLAQ